MQKILHITGILIIGLFAVGLSACHKEPREVDITTTPFLFDSQTLINQFHEEETAETDDSASMLADATALKLYAQLQEASEQGDLKKVRALLQQGADVNLLVLDETKTYESYYQDTPLMLASRKGHLDVVKELLTAGANVNQILPVNSARCMVPGEDATALLMGCRSDNKDVVKALASAGTNATEIIICACVLEDEELLQMALQQKPNLDFLTGDGGVSPLMMVAGAGNERMVKALLEAGADPNYPEDDDSALQAAKDYPKIVELLKSYGAKE